MTMSRRCLAWLVLVGLLASDVGFRCSAADAGIVPADPFWYLDDPNGFCTAVLGRVERVFLPEEKERGIDNGKLLYQIRVERVLKGHLQESSILLYGSLSYWKETPETGERVDGKLFPYSAGARVVVPIEQWKPDDNWLRRNEFPKGSYFILEREFKGTSTPWNTEWSDLYMSALVEYAALIKDAHELADDEKGTFWLKRMGPEQSYYMRQAALWWLGEIRYEQALPRLALALTEGAPKRLSDLRHTAASALLRFPREVRNRVVLPLAYHGEPTIRANAIYVLAAGADTDSLARLNAEFRTDPNDEVKLLLLSLLKSRGLMNLIEQAQGDPSVRVRERAQEFLRGSKEPEK